MEESSRPEAPPALLDLSATEGRMNELTRIHPDSPSVALDRPEDFIRKNTNMRPCTAWTNKKHSLYLDGLEASFAKQLHQSLDFLSWHSKQNVFECTPSRPLPVNADQFTVVQRGSSQKIGLERSQPLQCSASGSHAVTESPCRTIPPADSKEFNMFCIEGIPSRGKRIFSHGLTSSEQQCLWHQCHPDAVGSVAEVSDQNFVDEDVGEKSGSLYGAKRLKTDAADASTSDQIVPSGNLLRTDTFIARNPSAERKEQVHHKCLSEALRSSSALKANIKSFLRES